MSTLTPDEIRAAAETHSELGPDYQSAVIESFLDKVGKEIDHRVDARLAMARPQPQYPVQSPQQRPAKAGSPFALAIVSIIMGIPLSGINAGSHGGLPGLVVIWVGLALINIVYTLGQTLGHRDQ